MTSVLAPGFIVAVPSLLDPNFRQAVVLLLEENAEGAIGVVVNRESRLLLKELCSDHGMSYSGDPHKRVRTGGPVQPEQGVVLYGNEHTDPEGQKVWEGLHVSASKETLGRLCRLDGGRFHCYAGYAGWGAGQLQQEITQGSWITAPISPRLVLDTPPGDLWTLALQSAGIDPVALVPGSHQTC